MDYKEKLTMRKRRAKKYSLDKKHILSISLLIFTLVSVVTILVNFGKSSSNVIASSKESVKYYPRQYSDSNITDNAKITDPRFKNVTFRSGSSLLGNVISSIKKNDFVGPDSGPENGSWLWTPILNITPEYRDSIILGAKKNGVKNIYLSIDSYLDIYVMPDGDEKVEKKKQFDEVIRGFIRKAKENGITVDAEAGWRNWAEIGNSYKAFAIINYAIDFNKTNIEKFRGIQYDIEPYLLDYYEKNKVSVLGNFINLVDETVARLDGSDLILTVVIPEFYDATNNNTPLIFYAGKKVSTVDQLLRILDKRDGSKIIIMSYRNWSKGVDGSIDISKDEIEKANDYRTKIVLAQETGEVHPPYVTFHNTSKTHFKRQLGFLLEAFNGEESFDGIAIHYVNSYMEL